VRRRFLGLVASLVLATFGTVVLVGYVQSAHDKAAADEPTTPVLLVTKKIAKGTRTADLGDSVKVEQVAKSDKLEGAVARTSAIKDKVAVTDLLPGEQVLAERFDDPKKLGRAGVPKGMLEVTVDVAAARAVGGELRPGDTVAVFASFEPLDLDAAGLAKNPGDPAAATKTPKTTHVILRKVLVTHVQTTGRQVTNQKAKEKSEGKEGEDEEVAPKPAPQGEMLVTLAVDASAAERLVYSAEFGKIWLSAEPADAPDGGTKVRTWGVIYE